MDHKSRKVEIVCHRGANEYAPENTIASAQVCVDWGPPAAFGRIAAEVELTRR